MGERGATVEPARRGRLAVLGLLLVTVAGLLPGVVTAAPRAGVTEPSTGRSEHARPLRYTLRPGDRIAFHGHGTDHGVGMSQWGARGRAEAGQSYRRILAHYYRGTRIGHVDPRTRVRVLIDGSLEPTVAEPLRVVGRGGTWRMSGHASAFPPDAELLVWRGAEGWWLRVRGRSGPLVPPTRVSRPITLVPIGAGTTLEVPSLPTRHDRYRGSLRVEPDGPTVSLINDVALDAYLQGVVPAEVSPSWPVAALRAQAVAARSYAYVHLFPRTGSWDVHDDARSQVYRGVEGEYEETSMAVAATRGEVLMAGDRVVNAMFHTDGGLGTEHNELVYVSSAGRVIADAVSYLRGSLDLTPRGRPYGADSPYATWTSRAYSRAELSALLSTDPRTDVGTVTRIDLRDRGISGRIVSVRLIGTRGTRRVSGPVFKRVLNAALPEDESLPSTAFELVVTRDPDAPRATPPPTPRPTPRPTPTPSASPAPSTSPASDRTPPDAAIRALPERVATAGGSVPVRVAWTAVDRAGRVRSFDVEVSRDGGPWRRWRSRTRAAGASYAATAGHRYAFRVRARDIAGNVGRWAPVTTARGIPPLAHGFGRVRSVWLTVREAPGSGRRPLGRLDRGDLVRVTGGPVRHGTHVWFRIVGPLTTWPALGAPRYRGWVAARSAALTHLVAAPPPNAVVVAAPVASAPPAGRAPEVDLAVSRAAIDPDDPDHAARTTTIRYGADARARVTLAVWRAGQAVRTERSDAPRGPGVARWRWDGRDGRGRILADGTYSIRLTVRAGGRSVVRVLPVTLGPLAVATATSRAEGRTVVRVAIRGAGRLQAPPSVALRLAGGRVARATATPSGTGRWVASLPVRVTEGRTGTVIVRARGADGRPIEATTPIRIGWAAAAP